MHIYWAIKETLKEELNSQNSSNRKSFELKNFSNVKSYFNLLNATDYFKKMMKDYTIDSKRNKKFSDIHSLSYRLDSLSA